MYKWDKINYISTSVIAFAFCYDDVVKTDIRGTQYYNHASVNSVLGNIPFYIIFKGGIGQHLTGFSMHSRTNAVQVPV